MLKRWVWIFIVMLPLAGQTAFGQSVFVGPDQKPQKKILSVPFPFYNESFGAAVGYVYGVLGYPQAQSSLLAGAMAGTKGSAMGFLIGRDLRFPFTERLFLDPYIHLGIYKDIQSYTDGNPDYPTGRAGSNDSDKNDYIEGDGLDNAFRLRFKYVLPLGHGRDRIVSTYVMEGGLVTSGEAGATSWNPVESGKTYLEVSPFYRFQQIDGDQIDKDLKTNGLEVSIFWDNRDFFGDPTRGNALRLKASRDFGWFDTSTSWTALSGEWDQYFSLGPSNAFRQRVFAFDVWTAYVPTFDDRHEEDGQTVFHRPPAFAGATLGGLWRMRGYPASRFNDKAAIYYSAEYRMTPKWNPLVEIEWLQRHLEIAWWQWVPFVEVGRVAPEWSPDTLHSNMKWNAGLGIRLLAKGILARIDTAISEDGVGIAMMIYHPFQF